MAYMPFLRSAGLWSGRFIDVAKLVRDQAQAATDGTGRTRGRPNTERRSISSLSVTLCYNGVHDIETRHHRPPCTRRPGVGEFAQLAGVSRVIFYRVGQTLRKKLHGRSPTLTPGE